MFGAIEAGGTKMVVAIGNDNGKILKTLEIKTETPEDTLPKILDFYKETELEAIGIGAFGPVCVDPGSPDYGTIGKSSKLSWIGFSWKEAFQSLKIPIAIDTDVNAAALGEVIYGRGTGLSNVLYITIGTGVGVGVYSQGQLLHGMLHPEAGHIMLTQNPKDDFEGICPYHKNCFEGLAAGPAIKARYHKEAFELLDNEKVWELEAEYIGKALMQYICCYSPQRIILGGGVMHVEKLVPMIRLRTLEYLNGYIDTPEIKDINNYITTAGLGGEQGIKGALFLARNATR